MDSSRTWSRSLAAPVRRTWATVAAAVLGLAVLTLMFAPASAGAQVPPGTLPPTLEANVRAAVANEAGIPAGQVVIQRAERVTWTDGCLGIAPPPGGACTLALVSGWVVWASGNDVDYRLHTNYSGTDTRVAQVGVADVETDPVPSGATVFDPDVDALPEALRALVAADVAPRAGVTAGQVSVERVATVTWQDACIGVSQPGESCAEVLTEGYVVWVEAGGDLYRYHTDDAAIRFGVAGLPIAGLPLFELPEGATAREDGEDPGDTDGLLLGEVPTSGFALLQVSAASTATDLVAALVQQGCAPVSLAVTQAGSFVSYIPGAPAFVNAAFPVGLEANAGFVVRCA